MKQLDAKQGRRLKDRYIEVSEEASLCAVITFQPASMPTKRRYRAL